MDELLEKLPEQYQDVGDFKGKRDCETRWQLIRPYIKPYDVVMDVGSSLGYYGQKIVEEQPSALVISFESDPIMCQIQAKRFQEAGIYNVIVCNYRLEAEDLIRWSRHVELFDTVLALAVLHHYPTEAIPTVFNAFQMLAPVMIGEIPDKEEKEACGFKTVEQLWSMIEKEDRLVLGNSKSHLGAYLREIWRVERHNNRSNLDAFFGVSHEDRHRFTIEDGKINNKNIIKGLNVWNLLHFNIVWPKPKWWVAQSMAAYNALDFKSDVRPWNLLVTSTGVTPIDYTTEFPTKDPAEFQPIQMRKLKKVFTNMKPEW